MFRTKYSKMLFNQAVNLTGDTKEFFMIGSVPNEEPCTPAGFFQGDMQIIECHCYIEQIIRVHGEPPAGAEFFIIKNPHEQGPYYDVNVFYEKYSPEFEETEEWDGEDHPAMLYAYKVEHGCEKWDEQSLQFLKDNHYVLSEVWTKPELLKEDDNKVIPIKRKKKTG